MTLLRAFTISVVIPGLMLACIFFLIRWQLKRRYEAYKAYKAEDAQKKQDRREGNN